MVEPWQRQRWTVCLVLIGAFACGGCAPAYDAPTLFAELQHPDPEIRLDARQAIARLVVEGNHEVFVRGLDSPVDLHKIQSVLYLAEIQTPGASRALRELLAADRRMMLPFNPIRLKPSSEEFDSRIMVAHIIATRGGDPEALPILLNGLDVSQEPEMVSGACFAIGALGDPGGLPFLAAACRSPEEEVARAAVQALGHFKEPAALEALVGVASHPSVQVRGDILSSLSAHEPSGILPLLETLARSDPDERLRVSAIQRLEVGRDPSGTKILIELLRDPSIPVRAAAAHSLTRRTGEDFGQDPAGWSRWWSQEFE